MGNGDFAVTNLKCLYASHTQFIKEMVNIYKKPPYLTKMYSLLHYSLDYNHEYLIQISKGANAN